MAEFSDSHLSQVYESRLEALYGTQIASTLANGWERANLLNGEQMPYVRTRQLSEDERPVLYVPGFTEGIVAKAPFVGALALKGLDVILPGQSRKGILRNLDYKKDATYTQAVNYLSVLEAENLLDSGVDVITHSYGSLVFQAMVDIANETNHDTFKNANVVMLAPAGLGQRKEHAIGLGWRFMRMIQSEGKKSPKDFPDTDGEMFQAGIQHFRANIPRAVREILDIKKDKIDFDRLEEGGVDKVTIFGYAQDRLYTHKILEPMIQKAFINGSIVSYAVPISFTDSEQVPNPATHDDEQFNPTRVAFAVAQVLNS